MGENVCVFCCWVQIHREKNGETIRFVRLDFLLDTHPRNVSKNVSKALIEV